MAWRRRLLLPLSSRAAAAAAAAATGHVLREQGGSLRQHAKDLVVTVQVEPACVAGVGVVLSAASTKQHGTAGHGVTSKGMRRGCSHVLAS